MAKEMNQAEDKNCQGARNTDNWLSRVEEFEERELPKEIIYDRVRW
jgi:hypothetical protein